VGRTFDFTATLFDVSSEQKMETSLKNYFSFTSHLRFHCQKTIFLEELLYYPVKTLLPSKRPS